MIEHFTQIYIVKSIILRIENTLNFIVFTPRTVVLYVLVRGVKTIKFNVFSILRIIDLTI